MAVNFDAYENVAPLYLKLLHGNFLDEFYAHDFDQFRDDLRAVLARVDQESLRAMLRADWRAQLTGAWLGALRGEHALAHTIGTMLVESKTCYAGQGFAVFLASLGGAESAAILSVYLERWLPVADRKYDQEWVVAALMCVERETGGRRAAEFLEDPELWRGSKNPRSIIERMNEAVVFCRTFR